MLILITRNQYPRDCGELVWPSCATDDTKPTRNLALILKFFWVFLWKMQMIEGETKIEMQLLVPSCPIPVGNHSQVVDQR